MTTYRVIKGSLNHHQPGKLVEITPEHEDRGHDVERLLRLGVIVEDEGYEGETVEDIDGGALPGVPYVEPKAEAVTTPRAQSVSGGTKPPKPPKKPSAARKG